MKIKHLLIGLLAVAAAVSCKQEEVVETPSLELDKTSVSLAATSGEASFNVTTNQAWVATADADWVSLDPSSGEGSSEAVTVKVTAEDNESTEARTATVTVQAGELTKTVEVSQAAGTGDEPGPGPELQKSEWALVGNFSDENNWNPASDLYLSVLDEEYFVYYGFELAATTEFKFLKGGAWPPAGQEIGGNGLVEPNTIQPAGGSNIKVTEAGKYDIYLAADLTKFYVMSEGKLPSEATEPAPVENSWGMMGCFVDNQWGSDVPMTKEGEWIVAKGAQFTELTFKIRANSSWADATNIGVAPGSERGVVNGKISVVTAEYSKANCGGDAADIKLNGEAGTYDVYFSFENLEVYVMEEGYKPGEKEPQNPDPVEITYTVTGTIADNAWVNNAAAGLMAAEGDYLVAKNVPFVWNSTCYGGDYNRIEFKIVETGTWNGYAYPEKNVDQYANAEITVSVGGENIAVDAPEGNYDVYFDKANLKVWVMEAGYKPGEKEPLLPNPADLTEEKVIWEGSHDTGAWSGNQDLSYGGYDWSTVKAGWKLRFYVTPNDASSDWWCLSLRVGDEWKNLAGVPTQFDKPSYAITVELTQEIIDDLKARNGLVFTGSETTVTKISLLPEDAEVAMWEGVAESNGYSNCTIGTVNDWKNNGAAAGAKLRIYMTVGESWAMQLCDGQWNKWFATGSDGSQEGKYGHGFSNYNTTLTDGYVEFELTDEMVTTVAGYNWGNAVIIQGDQITITKICIK